MNLIRTEIIKMLFPIEIAKTFPIDWEGDLFDFLNHIEDSNLNKLNCLLFFCHPKIMKHLPYIHNQCLSVVPSLIFLHKKEANEHQIKIPVFHERYCARRSNDITQHRLEPTLVVDQIKDGLLYLKHLLSYLRSAYVYKNIHSFQDICTYQYDSFIEMLQSGVNHS